MNREAPTEMFETMTVKDYQNLEVDETNEIKKRTKGSLFRPQVDFNRMEVGQIVPVYEVINSTTVSYEYQHRMVKLI